MILLDADLRFSASELYQVCLDQLVTTSKELKPYETEIVARHALEHFHVFFFNLPCKRCLFWTTWPTIFLGNPAREMIEDVPVAAALPKHHSSPRQLSLIDHDSATAFHWPDRFDAEIARLEN